MTRYRLRAGGGGVDAQVIVAEFERIDVERGGITAEAVLDEARPAEAPLHPAFLWDDSKAGELYRLQQARNLVRAVHVIGDDDEDRGSAYVRVTAETIDGEATYRPVAEVVSSETLFESAIHELRANLRGATRAITDLEREARVNGHQKKGRSLERARKSVEQADSHLQRVGS